MRVIVYIIITSSIIIKYVVTGMQKGVNNGIA